MIYISVSIKQIWSIWRAAIFFDLSMFFKTIEAGFYSDVCRLVCCFLEVNPFQYIDDFRRIRIRRLLKIVWQTELLIMSLLIMSNFSICHNACNSLWQLYFYSGKEIVFICLSRYFQCRRLQICCVWERVKQRTSFVMLGWMTHDGVTPWRVRYKLHGF